MFAYTSFISFTKEPEIAAKPLWYRFFYYNFSCLGQRMFFYIVWTCEDMVNNASGFGFNGYDEFGNPKWDLLTNVNIYALEVMMMKIPRTKL